MNEIKPNKIKRAFDKGIKPAQSDEATYWDCFNKLHGGKCTGMGEIIVVRRAMKTAHANMCETGKMRIPRKYYDNCTAAVKKKIAQRQQSKGVNAWVHKQPRSGPIDRPRE